MTNPIDHVWLILPGSEFELSHPIGDWEPICVFARLEDAIAYMKAADDEGLDGEPSEFRVETTPAEVMVTDSYDEEYRVVRVRIAYGDGLSASSR
jgi:hypothetical protein